MILQDDGETVFTLVNLIKNYIIRKGNVSKKQKNKGLPLIAG
jgi:hypothetical protein